ncbi:MAG: hypothetical protein J6J36_09035 [Clostridia bacterium]|nr:hypothetical protein [Clostridia bacterium]
MKKIEDRAEEEKIRAYLKDYVGYYCKAMEMINIPVDRRALEELINEISIEINEEAGTTGTFEVSQVNKFFHVRKNNFEKNGTKRNNFLMLHEMTHLSNAYNKEMSEQLNESVRAFNEYSSIQNNEDLSGIDAAYGLISIDEVLAQWCCEKCNSAISGNTVDKHDEVHTILGNEVKVVTDFSEHDVYAPLEEHVEDFAISLGYKNLDDFARALIIGEISLFDYINEQNIEQLGYIGILCQGIYQENGFRDCGLPSTDIPKAVEYLKGRKQDVSFPTDPGDDGNR